MTHVCPALKACYVEGRHDCPANRYVFEQTGTQKWCVAKRLTPRLRAQGYRLAISQKRYSALYAAFERGA